MNNLRELRIDLNQHTFESYIELLESLALKIEDCIVVMDNKQFQTFKLMYRQFKNEWGPDYRVKTKIIEPTTMGYVFGLAYKVE